MAVSRTRGRWRPSSSDRQAGQIATASRTTDVGLWQRSRRGDHVTPVRELMARIRTVGLRAYGDGASEEDHAAPAARQTAKGAAAEEVRLKELQRENSG